MVVELSFLRSKELVLEYRCMSASAWVLSASISVRWCWARVRSWESRVDCDDGLVGVAMVFCLV